MEFLNNINRIRKFINRIINNIQTLKILLIRLIYRLTPQSHLKTITISINSYQFTTYYVHYIKHFLHIPIQNTCEYEINITSYYGTTSGRISIIKFFAKRIYIIML